MSETDPTPGPPKVIHAALFKMGTRSMAEAYKILGYHAHHGMDDIWGNPWEKLEKAAEAKWPVFVGPNASPAAADSSPTPKPFTREQWDELWSSYDAITDLGSPFADNLVQAYPDAKVVVVQRNFDTRWPSVRSGVLNAIFRRSLDLVLLVTAITSVTSTRKQMVRFFEARHPARSTSARPGRRTSGTSGGRELVPAERRLEYTMGSG
ncbi:hypothetical protein PG997_010077 [Apiospora hydei]|uniref:Sulfotransferase family protein n=1 Tax=Apiospora hydei TaxID=1337664 RepID=A0ABR1VVY7_9PEZI